MPEHSANVDINKRGQFFFTKKVPLNSLDNSLLMSSLFFLGLSIIHGNRLENQILHSSADQ